MQMVGTLLSHSVTHDGLLHLDTLGVSPSIHEILFSSNVLTVLADPRPLKGISPQAPISGWHCGEN